MNVLEYIKDKNKGGLLDQALFIKRTQQSKYWTYLMLRHYRRLLGHDVVFGVLTKADCDQYKAILEERSVLQVSTIFFLEGVPKGWCGRINLAKGNYLIAEVEDGLVEVPTPYYKWQKSLIKELKSQLGLSDYGRDLYSVPPWAVLKAPEELEALLLKAKWADWTVERLKQELEDEDRPDILSSLKRGKFNEVLELIERQGATWFMNEVTRRISVTYSYKSMVEMGLDPSLVVRELSLSFKRGKELEETARLLDTKDLMVLAERVVEWDGFRPWMDSILANLFVLRSGITVGVR